MKKFHSALFDFCWFPNYDASIEYLTNKINAIEWIVFRRIA